MNGRCSRFLECQECYITYVTYVVGICLMHLHLPLGAAHPQEPEYIPPNAQLVPPEEVTSVLVHPLEKLTLVHTYQVNPSCSCYKCTPCNIEIVFSLVSIMAFKTRSDLSLRSTVLVYCNCPAYSKCLVLQLTTTI